MRTVFAASLMAALMLSGCGPAATTTPEPTATPMPTATAEPEPTEANVVTEAMYAKWALDRLTAIGQGAESYGSAMTRMQADQSLLSDDAWRGEIVQALALMGGNAQAIRDEENIPAGAAEVHGQLELIASNIEQAADLFAKGLDNADQEAFTAGSVLMQQATGMIAEVATELVAMRDG